MVDDWFVEEVLPLEGMLLDFLRRNWRDDSEVLDLRQEVYIRMYESAQRKFPDNTKAFLFVTARNLMIDRARRAKVVSMELIEDFEQLSVYSNESGVENTVSSRQELRMLYQVMDSLPPRCREVVLLRKVRGMSQKKVAEKLGISESTVEKQVSKGIRKLADALYGVEGPYAGDNTERARLLRAKK